MTATRRVDGSGGSLGADERIDDIQFYIDPRAEAHLLIDDIVLYEAAPEGETAPFPRRVIFTGWFDTGKQGASTPFRGYQGRSPCLVSGSEPGAASDAYAVAALALRRFSSLSVSPYVVSW
jgi:hypothetical protein